MYNNSYLFSAVILIAAWPLVVPAVIGFVMLGRYMKQRGAEDESYSRRDLEINERSKAVQQLYEKRKAELEQLYEQRKAELERQTAALQEDYNEKNTNLENIYSARNREFEAREAALQTGFQRCKNAILTKNTGESIK